MNPENPYSDSNQPQPGLPPGVSPTPIPGRSSAAGPAIIAVIIIFGGFIMLACGGVLVGLMLPAVQAAREAARRVACQNNVKQIALAMHNYHDTYGTFPPAYTIDESGEPLHSWRTLILPFMEGGNEVYRQIDLSKPWDDPANERFAELDFPFYTCPSAVLSPGMTTYLAVDDQLSIFDGANSTSIQQITDGTSNTMLVVEVDPQQAVYWMQPADLDLPTFESNPVSSRHIGGCNCGLADGSVIFLSESISAEGKKGLVSKAGGEAPYHLAN